MSVVRFAVAMYPERQVFYRSRGQVKYLALSGRLQVVVSLAVVSFVGWIGFSTGYYFSFDSMMETKRLQVEQARAAYSEVVAEADLFQRRFAEVTQNLERSRVILSEMISISGVAGGKALVAPEASAAVRLARRGAGKRPESAPEQASEQVDVTRQRLAWQGFAGRYNKLASAFTSIGGQVKSIIRERGSLIGERDGLRGQVKGLELTLTTLRASQEQVLKRVTQSTNETVVEVEKLIAMTGLKVRTLLDRLDKEDVIAARALPGGQGGPFIEVAALPPGDPLISKVAELDVQMGRWHNLQRLLRKLPLVAPVDHYRLTSVFGKRIDPLRRRWGQHSGVDLANFRGTAILATAPGKVVYAGWRGGQGRMVEIDHGLGIRTRYAHLRKILVKKGEWVEFRDKIALMGSSGRSTGTHLHYEIRADGRPRNPLKFMKAGKYVFKGKQ